MASVECTDDVPTPDDIRPQIDEPLGNPEMSSSVDSSSTKSQLSADLDITDMYVALENVMPETRNVDQLTPHNRKCCTIYQKDFLIALNDSPLSRVRPANIPAAVLAVDRRLQINETPHKRSWGKDSATLKSQSQVDLNTADIYAALENIEPVPGNICKDSYSSSSSQSITQVPKLVATTVSKQSTASIVSPEEKMEITAGNCLNEYLCDNCSVNGFYLAIRSISRLFYPRIVSLSYMRVLEKSQYTRLKTGVLFGKLVKQEKLSVDEYCLGLEEILSLGECLVTDVPKIWDYIAEILVGLICDEALPLDRLKQSFNNTLTQKNAAKILVPLFKLVVEENGDSFLQGIWKKSGVQLAKFIDISEIKKLIADYPQSAAPTVSVVLSEDQMERRIGNSLDEYVSGNCTVDEYYLEISSSMPESFYPRMVSICYMRVLEKSQHTRLKTGGLFGKLVKQEKISVDDYCIGLEDILSQSDDLVIDVPKIWDYIAEILVDLICDEALLLDRLKQSLSTLTRKNASKILGPLFKLVVDKNGAVFLQSIWKKSGVQLADFVDSADINKFTADYKLEFLVGGGAPVEQNLSYSHIEVKLLELFKFNSDLDTVVQWITTNIGDNIKNNNKFVRTLATAIFQDSIDSNYKLANDRLRERNKLFMLYVDNRPEYGLQCLHALQALINKMEHPQGLLLSICNMLYELGTISQDCFIAWENCTDPAEQEGKGVAIKQLTSFFTQLKENEYDESDESDLA